MKLYLKLSILLTVLSITATSQPDTITILFASDTHSNLAPIGERSADLHGSLGGIARAATLIGMTKATDKNVLVVHAGDAFVGDIFYNAFFGIAELRLMGLIGYDFMTLGNHEFDLGPELLQMALDSSMTGNPLSIVSSNIIFPVSPDLTLKNYINQYAIKRTENVKIGIFGLTTPETNVLSDPHPISFDENMLQCAEEAIDSLQQNGCAVIICLSHLGIGLDTVLAASVPGIDVIISAHDHLSFPAKAVLTPSGKTTWISQANAFYTEMGKIQLLVGQGATELLSSSIIPLDQTIPEAEEVAAEVKKMIAAIEAQFGPMFTQRIGYAAEYFNEVAMKVDGTGPTSTAVGNLVTDAFREYTSTDIAIEPGGSTAQPLNKGPITGDDLFRVVGYGFNEQNYLGFRLATFTITGESLFIAMEKCLATIEANDEFFPQVSGMKFSYAPSREPGSRIDWILINNQPIDPVKRYSVTTNELAVTLLHDLLEVGISDISVIDSVSEYQVLAAYVAKRDTIFPAKDERITEIVFDHDAVSNAYSFSLRQNYPNPFNPSTIISFTLPKETLTTLKIYNILGVEIATLVDTSLSAGTHFVAFDAHRFASGIYFYTLTTNGFSQTKKMLLLR